MNAKVLKNVWTPVEVTQGWVSLYAGTDPIWTNGQFYIYKKAHQKIELDFDEEQFAPMTLNSQITPERRPNYNKFWTFAECVEAIDKVYQERWAKYV